MRDARFYLKTGVMKSNKSLELLTTAQKYEFQNKDILAFKPEIDDRTGNKIESRAIDYYITADLVVNNKNLHKMILITLKEKPNCILVDEIQFFTKEQIDQLIQIVDELNIPVIAYGLETDFQGKMFPGSKYAIENCDKREEIKTECFYCNRKATRNLRLKNGKPIFTGEQIMIGDEDYNPCCRKCFNNFRF